MTMEEAVEDCVEEAIGPHSLTTWAPGAGTLCEVHTEARCRAAEGICATSFSVRSLGLLA